jgi:predicted HicB family RNase H-like nuclease
MKTIQYKGYQASVEFEDGTLFIKILHIDDLLVAECDTASEAQKTVEELIDAYLEDCRALGRQPAKPFKGSFNVRMPPELHRRVAMAAAEKKQSLNAWISAAAVEHLQDGNSSG